MAGNFFQNVFWKGGVLVVCALLVAQSGLASTVRNPLKMFKRYFGTIEIASNGRGTRGTGQLDPATGLSLTKCPGDVNGGCTISVDVPAGVDIVAAFLYYEVLEKTDKPSSAAVYLRDPNSALLPPPNPDPHASPGGSECRPPSDTSGCVQYPVR